MIRQLLLLVVFVGTFINLHAQETESKILYSKVKINLEGKDIRDLAKLGIEVDHGHYHPGRFIENDYSEHELRAIIEAGFEYEVIIEDVVTWYQTRTESLEVRNEQNCLGGDENSLTDFEVPENFSFGSMMGFFKYEEMLGHLDAMREQYPHLISAKQPIEGFETIEGRPIYWLRISDNPDEEEADEPQIFYNAVHHAREVGSLSQLIFYMWYLLENYETNDEVKFLVDNTDMSFVPCINPDGYIYNEVTEPNGGGLWRKNRRQNADGSYGVDLNRNYGYEWAYDDTGSSPDPSADTYRGTEGFSEPETAAIKKFCEDHNFKITLNYHSYGNLLIYPWGYNDQLTPDSTIFTNMANAMTRENGYRQGTGIQTVGYSVNGDSDDWMYGDRAIYSFTPEVGTFWFWPMQSEIIPICKTTMLQNLTAAWMLHGINLVSNFERVSQDDFVAFGKYDIQHYGLESATTTVSFNAISNIVATGDPKEYTLDEFELVTDSISYEISSDIEIGDEVALEVVTENEASVIRDTIRFIYSAEGEVVFEDNLSDSNAWSADGVSTWETTTNEYYSAPRSMTDSYGTNYDNNITNTIVLTNPITIDDNITNAKLSFYTKWDIEENYDYVVVSLIKNNEDPLPLCGKYTTTGNENQLTGEPIYHGVQAGWVKEEMDLTGLFTDGDQVKFSFKLVTDQYEVGDGFYFDDIDLELTAGDDVNTTEISLSGWDVSVAPNPVANRVNFKVADVKEGMTVSVLSVLGQEVLTQSITQEVTSIDVANLTGGVYFCQLQYEGKTINTQKIIVE